MTATFKDNCCYDTYHYSFSVGECLAHHKLYKLFAFKVTNYAGS